MTNSDLEHLNLLPINQVACLKLRMVEVSADPTLLAVFQLMKWGIDAGVPLTHRRTARELERLRRDSDAGKALAYLLENLPGGVAHLHKRLIRLKPRAAAQLLLEILDMRLKADPRNPYPGGDSAF
ncbi:hypothetical protein Pcar_2603 [Syntrophotalea carbinolica DSM 2380]|uniref:Uncharacterized protein n=1 Tax=Syntrophotalea carbinolica (strain DSM 2380 / NBRC 103641 / GraBd1) TaxID=338963 RepID=Q3A1B6_SYNC1|nr:hypothetical protein [Syntrophotalea carbinolica]ABA89841.1 hypothetical protein Pcar_2603 [Syntrophotalea carbinolica DSM 2380]